MALKQGTLLRGGKYRIEKVIGKDDINTVYFATLVHSGERIVIKEFCKNNSYSGLTTTYNAIKTRFIQEGNMLVGLNHKFIVKCIDVFEEHGTAYYVTLLAKGVTLRDYLEELTRFDITLRISEQRSITIIKLIAEALEYLHKHGICHLDVKPSNIMYKHVHNEWFSSKAEPDSITLLSFGFARNFRKDVEFDNSELGVFSGHFEKPNGFVPLELSSGHALISPASDIYSLGAIWYFLLTGKRPPLVAEIINEDADLNIPGVSTEVNNAICAAMNPIMKRRPQSIPEFLALFGEKLDDPSEETYMPDFEVEAETVTEPQQSLAVGTELIGPSCTYIIQKVLGQGGFGITYLASVKLKGLLGTLNCDIKVAVKEFYMRDYCMRDNSGSVSFLDSSKGSMSKKYAKKFVKEALHLSKLEHQNIVKVAESFEHNNTSYYVMEYLDGKCLDDYVTENMGLSEYEAIKFIRQIGSALSYMHSQELLHMDVKPKNVMLKDGHCVLIDFGLAKQYDEHGQPESLTELGAGTFGYAPLEQTHHSERDGFAPTIDVYALGATLYKMLTSKTPPPASVILNDGFDRSELESINVSNGTINVIAMAMEPIKKERIQTIDEFLMLLPNEENVRNRNTKRHPTTEETVLADDSSLPYSRMMGNRNNTGHNHQCLKADINDTIKEALKMLMSHPLYLKSGCVAIDIPAACFNEIMGLNEERGKSNNLPAFATVHSIESFIEKLQALTAKHWRLPYHSEFMEFIRRDTHTGIIGNYYVYYDSDNASFHEFKEYDGEHGVISYTDLYFKKYKFMLVIDPCCADHIQTLEAFRLSNISYTCIIVDYKGLWYYGFCPVMLKGKWGIINIKGQQVLPFVFDEEPKIGLMRYASPGPGMPEKLRIRYRKGNNIGYYLIKENFMVEHETVATEDRWQIIETYS